VKAYIAGATAEPPANDYGNFMPPLPDTLNLLRDDDYGFFIVDKAGVIRYTLAGAYMEEAAGARSTPANDEILGQLSRL
jgi:hypothetical protein